jgi:glycogen(starch) synthase
VSVRIFYAAGPGQLVDAHKHWRQGAADPNVIAMTYSGQFADFCKSLDANVCMVSHGRPAKSCDDGKFVVMQRPKQEFARGGIGYHLAEMVYGIRLVAEALKFKADFAVVHSSSTHFFMLSLFRLAGIKIIPVLHNTLWPTGFPQTSGVRKIIRRLDAHFFRNSAHATLGVSPECLRQVRILSGLASPERLIELRGQFSRAYFAAIPPPPSRMRPFRVMFSGRIVESKGVFDLIEIARTIEEREPSLVKWDVCGTGPDVDQLRFRRDAAGLQEIVELHGRVLPPQMSEILARNHASIVPTKSSFGEGMALSAIEPMLANRPVITSAVVPAWEVLGGACLKAEVDDVESYVAHVLKLAKSPAAYQSAVNACARVKEPFLNGKMGFAAALKRAFDLK